MSRSEGRFYPYLGYKPDEWVAQRFGVEEDDVVAVRKALGIPPSLVSPLHLVDWYRYRGMPARQIAHALDLHTSEVREFLVEAQMAHPLPEGYLAVPALVRDGYYPLLISLLVGADKVLKLRLCSFAALDAAREHFGLDNLPRPSFSALADIVEFAGETSDENLAMLGGCPTHDAVNLRRWLHRPRHRGGQDRIRAAAAFYTLGASAEDIATAWQWTLPMVAQALRLAPRLP